MRPAVRQLAATSLAAVTALLAGAVVARAAPAPAAVSAPASTHVNSCPTVKPLVVRTAPGAGKTVALTFDDGPGPETPKVLEILRREHVRATFFEIGNQAAIWPGYARQVVQEGHLLGNHSYDHPDFAAISGAAQRSQLDRATTELIKATGTRPCWFRPPGGSLGSHTLANAAARHLRTAVWSVDTNDWAAGKTLNHAGRDMIRRNAHAGSAQSHPVLLMHDGGHQRPNMLAELPGVITYYKVRGYRFVDLTGHSGLKALPRNRIDYRKSPTGRVTTFTTGRGTITATGWSRDPDAPKAPVRVRMQMDNRWLPTGTTANRSLSSVRETSTSVDFSLTVRARKGRHTVCYFGVNTGAGATAGLGCSVVAVR